jgi:hypothetical protein
MVAGLFYLGVIGSNLHPLQYASDLAKGSTKNTAAQIESIVVPRNIKQMLVGRACTRVGILIAFNGGIFS